MNFENLVLRSLLAACVLVCGLMAVDMVTLHPQPQQLVATHAAQNTLGVVAKHCTLHDASKSCARAPV